MSELNNDQQKISWRVAIHDSIKDPIALFLIPLVEHASRRPSGNHIGADPDTLQPRVG